MSARKPPTRRRGRVTLWAPEANITVVVRNAELPQVDQEPAGGWRIVPRKRRRPLTVWDGPDALRERLVLHLDGRTLHTWMPAPVRDVEHELRQIRQLSRKLDGKDRPPWLRAIGIVPFPGTRWVIEKPQVEEQDHLNGRVLRAKVTLTLLEFVDPEIDLIVERPRAIARRRVHEWQRGDTLHKLAKRYLRDERRWEDIRAANPSIRAWSRVRPGTEIRIPVG